MSFVTLSVAVSQENQKNPYTYTRTRNEVDLEVIYTQEMEQPSDFTRRSTIHLNCHRDCNVSIM